jgi:hypothetical protein
MVSHGLVIQLTFSGGTTNHHHPEFEERGPKLESERTKRALPPADRREYLVMKKTAAAPILLRLRRSTKQRQSNSESAQPSSITS